MISFLKRIHQSKKISIAILSGVLTLTVALGSNGLSLGYKVCYNGEALGEASLTGPVIAQASETENSAYYLKIISANEESDQQIMEALALKNGEGVEACVLYLNGNAILAVESEEALEIVLEDYRNQYGEQGVSAFSKGVTFERKVVVPESVCSVEDAKVILGEADENGEPLLSVLSLEEATWEEYIPYETIYENTDQLTQGHSMVKEKGQNGVIRHSGYILTEDGEVTHEVRLASEKESDPVAQVVLVGTREPGTGEGTGTYVRPCSGRYSSGFGSRWGRNHNGVDLSAPAGTSIVAADSGTVTFAGWNNGGYGYLVKIDHGYGIESWYAHCSELLVEVGDVVSQGELIARVGSTGRSTGNHLHFEIRIGGSPMNPSNYVAF